MNIINLSVLFLKLYIKFNYKINVVASECFHFFGVEKKIILKLIKMFGRKKNSVKSLEGS